MDKDVTLRELDGFGIFAISVRATAPPGTVLASIVTGQGCPFAVIFQVGYERYRKGPAKNNQLVLVDAIVDFFCGC